MGKREKAINIYRHLLKRHHKSYPYQDLAELITEKQLKIALLTRAIATQREEKYRQRLRFKVANLLFNTDKPHAKYELEKCIAARKAAKYSITWEMQNLSASLEEVVAASEIDQKAFYQAQAEVVENYVRMVGMP